MPLRILFFFSVLFIVACQSDPSPGTSSPSDDPDGTQQMIDSINAIISRTNFRKHPYETSEKLKLIEQEVQAAQARKNLSSNLVVEYGKTLMEAGKSKEAITIFETLLKQLPENQTINQTTKNLHEALALSYIRLGEQTNCIDNHSSESCLLPIRGRGIHTTTDGSRSAIDIYTRILGQFPDDLRCRWMLNLAYMTLGEHPDKVPPSYLIPPDAFKPEYDLPYFENIALQLGVDVNELAGGVILDDFNNDGWLDILVSSWGMFGRMHYFESDGKGNYIDKTDQAGLKDYPGGLNLIQADYDNDGWLDVFVMRGAWRGLSILGHLPNSLLRNNGDGTFSDVTFRSGIYALHPTQSATWLDFNADGWLDLFVANETHTPVEQHPCQLYLNKKDGTFIDIAAAVGLNITALIKGVVADDINNDGLPDLYLSNLDGPNLLLLNKGGKTAESWQFENIAMAEGVEEPIASFPTWFFDYDNDGWVDIFVSSFDQLAQKRQSWEVAADFLGLPTQSDTPRLYHNEGDNHFSDRTKEAGLDRIIPAMGCNFGDLDNDGFSDFYLGTGAPDFRAIVPNRMFRNNNGNAFQDVTFAGHFGHIQKGHGISFADLDGDGDQDIYAVMGGSVSGDFFQNALFENPGSANNWLTIRLEGLSSNRSAVGARIRLELKGPKGQKQFIYRSLNSGGSFGANSLQQEIGLGAADAVEKISVNWPDGKPEFVDYGACSANQIILIKEGLQKIQVLPTQAFQFNKKQEHHHHHHQQ